VLIAGVVDDQLDHDLHVAGVGFVEELLEVGDGAVGGIDVGVVGDVVAVVAEWRGEEGENPEAGDAKILEVVELGDEALEVADAVGVGVGEGADVQLVDDRVFVPEWVGDAAGFLHVLRVSKGLDARLGLVVICYCDLTALYKTLYIQDIHERDEAC